MKFSVAPSAVAEWATLCSASSSLMLACRLNLLDDCQGGKCGRACSCRALGDRGVGGARLPEDTDAFLWFTSIASLKVQFNGDLCAEPGVDFITRPCATPLITLEDRIRRSCCAGAKFCVC